MRSIKTTRRRTILLTVASMGVVLVIGILWLVLSINNREPSSTGGPSFSALLPKDTSIDTLGGWQKGTPPNGTASYYVFVDTVEGVTLRVSQQELPKELQNNAAQQVAQIAESDNATRTLQVGDIKVYIGTSAQGPQSLYFTKNSLLVLIKSEQALSDEVWKSYIASLRS